MTTPPNAPHPDASSIPPAPPKAAPAAPQVPPAAPPAVPAAAPAAPPPTPPAAGPYAAPSPYPPAAQPQAQAQTYGAAPPYAAVPPQAAPGGATPAAQATAQAPGYASPIPVRPTHLGHAIASEWTKISSVRSTVWTLVTMFAVTVGVALLVSLAVSSSDDQGMEPTGPGFIGILLGHVAILTFGVLVMSTEYTTGMIRTTLTASPQRGRLLVSKALVFSLLTFTATATALGLSFALSHGVIGETVASRTMPDGAWVDAILGVALYVTLLGLLGLAMGALLRSSAGAITMMLGVVLLPTIGGSFLYISENLHDLADKVQDFSAIGAMSSLSLSYGSEDFTYSGWPQTALLGAVVVAALIGAYARLASSDA